MTSFDTVADAMGATRTTTLATGLPQLDRLAPLGPGRVAVIVGASAVGKSRIASHIAATLNCTHEHGVLTVSSPTTLEAIDSSLAFTTPALCVIDPLTALATPVGAVPPELIPVQRTPDDDSADGPDAAVPPPRAPQPADPDGGDRIAEQRPVHPVELGRIAAGLRDFARRRDVAVLACHRYAPIRDTSSGQVVPTEAVNPLFEAVDVVIVARVQDDPTMIGLEIIRNTLGPTMTIRVPLAMRRDC